MTPSPRQDTASHLHAARDIPWLWPLLACIAGWWQIAKHFDDAVLYDAQNVYLPAAKALLAQGWSYLLTPDSYRVVPLAYLWPALWGADPTWIRIANAGLWAGCVYFLWRTGCLLGGNRAGAAALLLLVVHPELPGYFPTELTEPIFLFGLFGWMYAMAQMLISHRTTALMALLGAFMLTLTLLSRPVLQLLAPAGLGLCLAGIAYRRLAHQGVPDTPSQRALNCIAWSLALGLLLPVALIAKNGMTFGLWGLGTGAGTGLYLGTHPLFQGAEPGFLGLPYDVGLLTTLKAGNDDHLSLAGDGVAHSAALWQIQAMSLKDAVAFFSRKLWWWLAHHPASIEATGSLLRTLRFFELLVICTCVAWLAHDWWPHRRTSDSRPSTFAPRAAMPPWAFPVFLLAMFLAMLAQLLPILYNSRYSSALLDPWLIPLTAWGLTRLTTRIRRQNSPSKQGRDTSRAAPPGTSPWPSLGLLAAILAMTLAGYGLARKHENIAIDPRHLGSTLIHLDIDASNRVDVHGMSPQNDRTWIITESPAVLHIRVDESDVKHIATANIFTALWKTDLALHSNGQRCRMAEVSYQTADGRILQPAYKLPLLLPLQTDGILHPLVTHAHAEMTPREPGSLRIALHCQAGTVVQWRGTQFLEGRYPWDVATHIHPRLQP